MPFWGVVSNNWLLGVKGGEREVYGASFWVGFCVYYYYVCLWPLLSISVLRLWA